MKYTLVNSSFLKGKEITMQICLHDFSTSSICICGESISSNCSFRGAILLSDLTKFLISQFELVAIRKRYYKKKYPHIVFKSVSCNQSMNISVN